MQQLSRDLEDLARQPAMRQKVLGRAAELVALGWTRRTAARDADGEKVRSTAPQATAWCVVGAVDRALYELLNVDVYEVLGVDVDAYDVAPCQLAVVRGLRQPLQRVLGRPDLANWNDFECPGSGAAERLLRTAAELVAHRILRARL